MAQQIIGCCIYHCISLAQDSFGVFFICDYTCDHTCTYIHVHTNLERNFKMDILNCSFPWEWKAQFDIIYRGFFQSWGVNQEDGFCYSSSVPVSLVTTWKCLFNFKLFFIILCVWVFCLHIFLCTTCEPGAQGGQKRDSLKMEFQTGAAMWMLRILTGCHVDAENLNWYPERAFNPLSHLFCSWKLYIFIFRVGIKPRTVTTRQMSHHKTILPVPEVTFSWGWDVWCWLWNPEPCTC